MKPSISTTLLSFFHINLIVFSTLQATTSSTSSKYESFLHCLSAHSSDQPSIPVYTPNTLNYTTILRSSIENLRFLTPTTPKPQLIITPLHESQVQATVICCRNHGLQIRVRSGGHDYEGLSYTSYNDIVPFVILDLFNLQSISVEVEEGIAWVESGATIGQLHYRIAEKSPTYGFPTGNCPTIGIGGHFSGGGHGYLQRKYGLSADNIIDAKIVNVDGKILNKESMGEDLFWAIRGGGAASFGIVLAWKIKLASVSSTVTVFAVSKTLEQGAIPLVHKWQYIAPKLPEDLVIAVIINEVNINASSSAYDIQAGAENKTVLQASFTSLFLGGTEQLLGIMEHSFPELGLQPKDCREMRWIQSVLYVAGLPIMNVSLSVLGSNTVLTHFKGKSDYVYEPISEIGLQGIWRKFSEEANNQNMLLFPNGGRISKIPDVEIPFPHRAGSIYHIVYLLSWNEEGIEASRKNIDWLRRFYEYMAPYVSKSPRAAYLNVRELDLGHNEISTNGTTSYEEAKVWGSKYFKNNFDRLVKVKSKVDPENFFKNEQSIPPAIW